MIFPSPTPRQARIMMLALTGFAIAVLAGLLAALVWAVGRVLQILSPVLWPLAAAGVIAYSFLILEKYFTYFFSSGMVFFSCNLML